ncbi:hypothetical protein UFOVP148_9 [uncultured Caudovirales phage]|uniref:Uncharacterized protein n=1 Tax=uncultured Caudovirales phage TaxID=2100421 RepID=A0A6J7W4Y5_9CAUD|nr:hypothetical protein UFOVP148_9 [uncultured Caudovirales phage]
MKTRLQSLMEEAKIQSQEHPSKDARFFAHSVYTYLTEENKKSTWKDILCACILGAILGILLAWRG